MWRLLVMVVVAGLAFGACSESEVDVEEFYRRIRALGDGTFTVTYVMETTSSSETEARDLVWYRGGRVDGFPLPLERMDTSSDFGLIVDIGAPTSYRCGDVEGEQWCSVASCCRESEPTYWFVMPSLDRNRATVIDSRSEEIAGYDVECYEIETGSSVPYATHEMCLSEEGLLLSGRTAPLDSGNPETKGTVISMLAVDAKTEVADDVFEPPYPVIDRP